MTATQRQAQLKRELSRISRRIIANYRPEQIIVFGSYARGTVRPWSDLDIAVVKRTTQPFLKRAIKVAQVARPKVGVDFLVYTPAELKTLRRERHYFAREIDRGEVIYERATVR